MARATSTTPATPSTPRTQQLEVVYRKTSTLIPDARNSRLHSEAQVAQIAASIREFGFTNPVLIDEAGGIIAGHGRVLAAQLLELGEVPTITLAWLTPIQKRAYLIADNKLPLNASWDLEMLSLELQGLTESGFATELVGFTSDEVESILKGWEHSSDPEDTDPSDDPLKAIVRVRCNQLDVDDLRETLRRAVLESGLEGAEVLDG